MTVQITQEWLYVAIILVLMGIQVYQRTKINRLYKESVSLWENISILTMTVANKFTELDTKIGELKDQVVSNVKKEDIKQ